MIVGNSEDYVNLVAKRGGGSSVEREQHA